MIFTDMSCQGLIRANYNKSAVISVKFFRFASCIASRSAFSCREFFNALTYLDFQIFTPGFVAFFQRISLHVGIRYHNGLITVLIS